MTYADISDSVYPLRSLALSPHFNRLPNVVVVAYLIPCLFFSCLSYLLYVYVGLLSFTSIRPVSTIDECSLARGQTTGCYPLNLQTVNRRALLTVRLQYGGHVGVSVISQTHIEVSEAPQTARVI